MKPKMWSKGDFIHSLTFALPDGGGRSTSHPGRFTHGEEHPVPTLQEPQCAFEPMCTGTKNLSPTTV